MNVLSLFDGMSCGQIALERAGIEVDNYYASEIDKYAIKVAQANYPKTVQLGDVKSVNASDLPKIDLLIGGSPCQGFSLAGNQLNFDDPRSALFFEFTRLLKECKPKYFLLENVKMKKEYQDVISKHMGVEPIKINSSLVSAQNRTRLYWTNIEGVGQPGDKGVFLKDILESGYVDRDKSYCIDANYFKGGNLKSYFEKGRRQLVFCGSKPERVEMRYDGKANTLTVLENDNYVVFVNGFRKLTPLECERLQTVPDGYTNHVSNTQRYKMLGNGWTVDITRHIFEYMKGKN